MQRNVDGQLFGVGIEVSRGEVARFEIASCSWNIELDMIVGGWGREVLEILAAKDYSQHPRCEVPLFQHGERSTARSVSHAEGSVFGIALSFTNQSVI